MYDEGHDVLRLRAADIGIHRGGKPGQGIRHSLPAQGGADQSALQLGHRPLSEIIAEQADGFDLPAHGGESGMDRSKGKADGVFRIVPGG